MQKYILLLAVLTTAKCLDGKKYRVEDPFSILDKHLSHTFAYHYMWPWSQLIRAATALELEDTLKEPQIISDPNKFQVNLDVKRFSSDELKIRVKNRYIIVEGRHRNHNEEQNFMANHFVQRFVMPPGCKQEDVTAVLSPDGILSISAPKYPLPPPIPEREVPIQLLIPEKTTAIPEKATAIPESPALKPVTDGNILESNNSSTEKKIPTLPSQSSSATPLEQLEPVEATTHVGKIRKKELKTTTKTTRDNEVTKGVDNNGLDDSLNEE